MDSLLIEPAVVTGILSEIPEILFLEITDELLRSNGHMKISIFAIPSALLCIERCS